MRAFVELGQTMQELLTRLPKQDASVQRLLAAFSEEATKAGGGAELMATDASMCQS